METSTPHRLPTDPKPTAATRHHVADALREIGETLELNSVGVAAVLRNPGEEYPRDGLIRLMLTERQDPSDRFIQLVDARLAELHAQAAAGVQALVIAGRLVKVYHVTPKQHFRTIASAAELAAMSHDDIAQTFEATASVPAEWTHHCAICDQIFVARSSRQQVCRRQDAQGRFPCVRAAAHRRYLVTSAPLKAARKAAQRAARRAAQATPTAQAA